MLLNVNNIIFFCKFIKHIILYNHNHIILLCVTVNSIFYDYEIVFKNNCNNNNNISHFTKHEHWQIKLFILM